MDKKPPRAKACYFLGLAGIIGVILFLLILLALDIIQSGSNPILKTISDLVHGSYGWLQSMAFILTGFGLFIFVYRLYSMTVRKIGSLTGASSLGVTSIGFILIAVLPSQASGSEHTLQELLHNSVTGLITSSFIIGCIAFAVHFRADPKWKRYWGYTAVIVILCLAFALLWALIPPEWELVALGERLLLMSGLSWVAVISLKLVKLCQQPQEVA